MLLISNISFKIIDLLDKKKELNFEASTNHPLTDVIFIDSERLVILGSSPNLSLNKYCEKGKKFCIEEISEIEFPSVKFETVDRVFICQKKRFLGVTSNLIGRTAKNLRIFEILKDGKIIMLDQFELNKTMKIDDEVFDSVGFLGYTDDGKNLIVLGNLSKGRSIVLNFDVEEKKVKQIEGMEKSLGILGPSEMILSNNSVFLMGEKGQVVKLNFLFHSKII